MDYRLRMQHGRQQHGVGISKPPPAKGKVARKYSYKDKQCSDHADADHLRVRVVYIASPMKLTATPEEFRAVVQELTGRHSNIADRHYVDSIHPPPPACASIVALPPAAAPPPPSVLAALVPAPPLPQQMFQSSDNGEHEQAAGLCYGQGYVPLVDRHC